MRVDNNVQNINFSGIKLSHSSFKYSQEVVSFLRRACVNVAGYKKFYNVLNTFNSKAKAASYVRSKYQFNKDECGIIFFPFSREAWVISSPLYEQELYKLILDYDEKAKINLLI